MTNFEYYKEEILKISNKGHTPMLHNGIPNGSCEECDCSISGTCDLYNTSDCTAALLKWLYEEHIDKPKLTKKERQFCELVETGWIARDGDPDNIIWYKGKPVKSNGVPIWNFYGNTIDLNRTLNLDFSFITWEDEEPWSVEELLKLEVE